MTCIGSELANNDVDYLPTASHATLLFANESDFAKGPYSSENAGLEHIFKFRDGQKLFGVGQMIVSCAETGGNLAHGQYHAQKAAHMLAGKMQRESMVEQREYALA